MKRFEIDYQVRVDIPDETDPDHERLHRKHGTIVEILEDDAGEETGDPRDSYLFIVDLDNGTLEHLRWRDLRPVPDT
jgi:hypothetical protein